MVTAIAVLALLLSAAAAFVSWQTWRRVTPDDGIGVPADLEGMRRTVAALADDASRSLSHLAVVRYDAFDEMGGRLSWSLALLDAAGDGVVLTSIRGRNEARTYAKEVAGWGGVQELSPEETEAVTEARG